MPVQQCNTTAPVGTNQTCLRHRPSQRVLRSCGCACGVLPVLTDGLFLECRVEAGLQQEHVVGRGQVDAYGTRPHAQQEHCGSSGRSSRGGSGWSCSRHEGGAAANCCQAAHAPHTSARCTRGPKAARGWSVTPHSPGMRDDAQQSAPHPRLPLKAILSWCLCVGLGVLVDRHAVKHSNL